MICNKEMSAFKESGAESKYFHRTSGSYVYQHHKLTRVVKEWHQWFISSTNSQWKYYTATYQIKKQQRCWNIFPNYSFGFSENSFLQNMSQQNVTVCCFTTAALTLRMKVHFVSFQSYRRFSKAGGKIQRKMMRLKHPSLSDERKKTWPLPKLKVNARLHLTRRAIFL